MTGKQKKILHFLFFGTFLVIFILSSASVYAVVGGIEIVAGQEGQPVPEKLRLKPPFHKTIIPPGILQLPLKYIPFGKPRLSLTKSCENIRSKE